MSQFTGSEPHNLMESSIDYSTIFKGVRADDQPTYIHPNHGVLSLVKEKKDES